MVQAVICVLGPELSALNCEIITLALFIKLLLLLLLLFVCVCMCVGTHAPAHVYR